MKKIHDIIILITLIGGIHGVFLGFVIRSIKKGNLKANKIFSALLFFFCLGIADSSYYSFKLFLHFPHFLDIFKFLPFFYSPLFYLYVKAHTQIGFKIRKQDYLHFIPGLLYLLYSLPSALQKGENKLNYLLNNFSERIPEMQITIGLMIVQFSVYIVLVFLLLRNHAKTIRQNFSDIQAINLSWLRNLLTGFLVSLLLLSLLFWLTFSDPGFHKIMDDLIYFYVSIILFWVGYRGLKQPEIFNKDSFVSKQKSELINKKYEKSPLTSNISSKYAEKLLSVMKRDKPYLNPEITLPQLSEELEIPVYQLSQIINEKMNQNFYRFINSYRVKEAKQRLINSNHADEKLIKIAFDVGFNSNNTFFRVFKEFTGETPSRFRTTKSLSTD